MGEYENFNQAIEKQTDLESKGIQGNITVENAKGDISSVSEEQEAGFISETGDNEYSSSMNSDRVVYRVQVGAFRYDLSENIFRDINDLIVLPGVDGLTRYMTDSYEDPMEAAKRRVTLLTKGFEGSFITAYRNGKRITLNEAGLNVTPGAQDLVEDEENNSITPEDIKFYVNLGEFNGEIPTEILDSFIELGDVKPKQIESKTHFVTNEFSTLELAQEFLRKAEEKGINTAQIMGSFNGNSIPLEEALKLMK